jgi:thymidylate synthase (methanogen type)
MIIESNSFSDAWEKSIFQIIEEGEWIPAERGNRTIELRNVFFCITSPLTKPQISSKYSFPESFVEEYSSNYLLSETDIESVATRILRVGSSKVNQIEKVTDLLSSHYYSRRAIISTWVHSEDLFTSHPPCLLSMQFQVRNKLLEVTAVLRSNDAWFAAPLDFLAINKVQINLAKRLDLEVGCLHMLSTNYHIYEMDLLKAINIFKQKA